MQFEKLINLISDTSLSNHAATMRIMTHCLKIIDTNLPEEGLQAMKVASAYWSGNLVDSSKIIEARVACWNYLDERKASTNTTDPKYCALRAVICVLFESTSDEDDLEDAISCFLEFLYQSAMGIMDFNTFSQKVELEVLNFKKILQYEHFMS